MATTNGHPATPPPSDPSLAPQPQQPQQPSNQIEVPLTSLTEDPTSKKPRDARLIHTVLSSMGISHYQQRVPLQLLDFSYRYTSSLLSDSLRLSAEGYTSTTSTTGKRSNNADDLSNISITAVRQAVASRLHHTFTGPLEKDTMLEQAEKVNRVALPRVERGYGVMLPPEKYCLTGVGWNLRDQWESDEEDEDEAMEDGRPTSGQQPKEDERMDGVEMEDEDEEGAGRMEDVFGESGGDTTMAD